MDAQFAFSLQILLISKVVSTFGLILYSEAFLRISVTVRRDATLCVPLLYPQELKSDRL